MNPSAIFHLYEPDEDICVYRTLLEYLKKTEVIRGTETQLILSYIKPHEPVVTTSISRWIKVVIKAKKFGVPLTEIMKVAGWSTEQTIARFYDKPLETQDGQSFQMAALQ